MPSHNIMGFHQPVHAVVLGASGALGEAVSMAIARAHPENQVWGTGRRADAFKGPCTRQFSVDLTDEASIETLAAAVKEAEYRPNLVLNCTGLLHTHAFGPEKTWRHLDLDTMRRVFDVNTFGVALLGKHLIPLFPRKGRSVFATLSARVGSISDNRLGGWYSYRASKAAQNMIVRTLAVEARRKWEELICVALHPGTVDSSLSEPFSARVPAHKLFTPEQSCDYLIEVLETLRPSDSGGFFAWDGKPIEF